MFYFVAVWLGIKVIKLVFIHGVKSEILLKNFVIVSCDSIESHLLESMLETDYSTILEKPTVFFFLVFCKVLFYEAYRAYIKINAIFTYVSINLW